VHEVDTPEAGAPAEQGTEGQHGLTEEREPVARGTPDVSATRPTRAVRASSSTAGGWTRGFTARARSSRRRAPSGSALASRARPRRAAAAATPCTKVTRELSQPLSSLVSKTSREAVPVSISRMTSAAGGTPSASAHRPGQPHAQRAIRFPLVRDPGIRGRFRIEGGHGLVTRKTAEPSAKTSRKPARDRRGEVGKSGRYGEAYSRRLESVTGAENGEGPGRGRRPDELFAALR